MNWRNLTPRSMVILYFGGFALLWGGIAATAIIAGDVAGSLDGTNTVRASWLDAIGMLVLAFHATAIALLAWKARRWFFSHGPFAVVASGLPLVLLVANVWFVPAFLYLIAVLHVGLASRHESLGRLQSTRRHGVDRGQA